MPVAPNKTLLRFFGPRGVKLSYLVSADDILWLHRAVQAEGPVQECVAQTLVNCFCLRRAQGATRGTLTDHVRAYAQPINPHWYSDGDLHIKYLALKQDTEANAHVRETVHSARNYPFSPRVEAAVERALLQGQVDIPKNCTDYAAARIDASKKYRAITVAQPGVNRLWTRDRLWTGYSVACVDG